MKPAKNIKMSQVNLMEEFKAGLTACLRSWSALRTAVESGWGGGEKESQAKGNDLRGNILECMDGSCYPPPNMEVHDLADNLAIYLEEEFSVTLEDKSEQQVAETIFAMYEGCFNRGDPTLAREMVARASNAVQFNSQFPVQLQTTEHDDDDDDDDMGVSDSVAPTLQPIPVGGLPQQQPQPQPQMITMSMSDYGEQPLFGKAPPTKPATAALPVRQLGEAAPTTKPEMEVDDDGFAPVARKGRRK